jgi:hypothetical protein
LAGSTPWFSATPCRDRSTAPITVIPNLYAVHVVLTGLLVRRIVVK